MTREEAINILSIRDNRGVPVTWQNGFSEAVDMAIEALKAQLSEEDTTFGKWIPVSERLPKIRYDVLITVWFHGTRQTKLGYRQQGEWMFWHEGHLESYLDGENKVIAWMPLIDPYCGETYKGEFMTPPVGEE